MKQHALILAVLLALWLPRSSPAGNTRWTSIRGTVCGKGSIAWTEDAPPPPIREWLFRSGTMQRRHRLGLSVWASPALAVVHGRPMAFIGGYDQRMHALDLAGGERLWSRLTNGDIASAPAVEWVGDRQVVFWGAADRTLYAHFADDGTRLWTRELVRPTSTMGEALMSAPLLHDGVVYISCFVHDRALSRYEQKGWLLALRADDGRPLWKYEVSQGPVGAPVGRVMDGRFVLFIAAQKGLLQALDVSQERPHPLWSYQMPHEVLGAPAVQPDAEDPLLFLGSKFGNFKALDARTGREVWQSMAGNWIDNTAAVGSVDGRSVVFVGSHDYHVYAFRAEDGTRLWRSRLPGEVFSAISFFHLDDAPALAVAAHDHHLHVLDAGTGRPIAAFFIGLPVWNLISKGDTLWGSPAVWEAGQQTAIVHGSYSDVVFVLPMRGESLVRTRQASPRRIWLGLGLVCLLFFAIVLPVLRRIPERSGSLHEHG